MSALEPKSRIRDFAEKVPAMNLSGFMGVYFWCENRLPMSAGSPALLKLSPLFADSYAIRSPAFGFICSGHRNEGVQKKLDRMPGLCLFFQRNRRGRSLDKFIISH